MKAHALRLSFLFPRSFQRLSREHVCVCVCVCVWCVCVFVCVCISLPLSLCISLSLPPSLSLSCIYIFMHISSSLDHPHELLLANRPAQNAPLDFMYFALVGKHEQVACRCAQSQCNIPRATPPPRSTRRQWIFRRRWQAGPPSTLSCPSRARCTPGPLNASWVCGASAVSALCPPQRDPIGQCIKSASHHIIGGERRPHDEREAESVHAHEPLHPVPPKKHREL